MGSNYDLSLGAEGNGNVGLGLGSSWRRSSSRIDTPTVTTNPDPSNYRVLDCQEFPTGYTIIKLRYPDCTNFEGVKILVFAAKLRDILVQHDIDPHFSESKIKLHPIARFVPTEYGWELAVKFVNQMEPIRGQN